MKRIFEFLKDLIFIVCLIGQLILIIRIAEFILKNQDLGMLILYYIFCDFVCSIIQGNSLTKTIFLMVFKNEQKTESQNNKNN